MNEWKKKDLKEILGVVFMGFLVGVILGILVLLVLDI